MDSTVNYLSIYISDAFSVCLMAVLLPGRLKKIRSKNTENWYVLLLMIVVLVCSAADGLSYIHEGTHSRFGYVLTFICNNLLYIGNILCGYCWMYVIARLVNSDIPTKLLTIIRVVCLSEFVLLIVNCFVPIIFDVNELNVYTRGPVYWIFILVEAIHVLFSMFYYMYIRRKAGFIKYYSIWLCTIPIVIGVTVQMVFYGISTVWPSIGIGVVVLLDNIQYEQIFKDTLTGLYNRSYLDLIMSQISHSKNDTLYCIMMIDINRFKSVNDKYGHLAGDEVLIDTADILRQSVGRNGSVIRYAGDEFIILIPHHDSVKVEEILELINKNVAIYNKAPKRDFMLSFSIGHSDIDVSKVTADEMLQDIDNKMYKDKDTFYRTHLEFNRRKNRA